MEMKRKLFDPAGLEVKSIVDDKSRTIWHPITREVEDRYGDIVRADGMDSSDFARKPAVLYGHDYTGKSPVTIIGENVGFRVEDGYIYAGTKFLDTSDSSMSQPLKDLVNDNWILQAQGLMGWSIGFMPVEVVEIMEGGKFKGYDFKKWKLLEYSSVIIPAHQDAVNDSVSKGLVTGAVLRDLDPGPQLPCAAAVEIKAAVVDGEIPADAQVDGEIKDEPQEGEDVSVDNQVAEEPAGDPEPEIIDPVVAMASGSENQNKEIENMEKNETKDQGAPFRHVELGGNGNEQVRSIGEIQQLLTHELTTVEREIQRHVDDAIIVGQLLKKDPRTLKMWGQVGNSAALRKAMDTATANEGTEFVPTILSADFMGAMRLEAKVAGLFTDLTMPSNPFKLPYFGGIDASSFYAKPEAITDTPTESPPSTPATDAITLTAKSLIANIPVSDELIEDSIVAILPMLRAELVKGGARAWEDVLINGDITATHQDSDVTDSRDRRKLFSTLRKLCYAGSNKADLSTFSSANVLALITAMGKYGIVPGDLAFITGAKSFNKFRANSDVLTVDKYGPSATLLSGELGKFYGTPIIVSEAIRENLNASGVYDGSTTTYTQFLIVYRPGFIQGTRGVAKLSYVEDPKVGQNYLVLNFRKAFAPRWTPSATYNTIGMGYKVS